MQKDGIYVCRIHPSLLSTTLAPHAAPLRTMALTPNGETLACLEVPVRRSSEVTIWQTGRRRTHSSRVITSRPGLQVDPGMGNPSLAFAPDGRRLAFTANIGEKAIGSLRHHGY